MREFKVSRLFSHESKERNFNVNSNDGILCVRNITSRCVILIAQFKWRSGGVFQWRISQITQWNCCMNALTSKLWFGGAELRDFLTTSANIPHAAYVQKHRKRELLACLIGRVPRHEPHIFSRSGMLNRKFSLSCVHCTLRNSNIAITSLVCILCNSNCTIQMVIQIVHFALVWKQETRAPCMFDWQGTQTRATHLLPLWNAEPQIRSLVCTLHSSNIAITSLVVYNA